MDNIRNRIFSDVGRVRAVRGNSRGMEVGTMTKKPYYGVRYIIPDWDGRGNHQMYYRQSNGTWMDTFNECERSQAWIDEHVAKYIQPAPDDISLIDFLNSLNDLSARITGIIRTEDGNGSSN
jgi:hypothetical protein